MSARDDPGPQENAIRSAQVMVRDLSPGNEPHPRPSTEQFPEQHEGACFTHSKGSQRQEKKEAAKKRKEAGSPPPLPPQFSFQIHPEQLPAATGNPSQSGKVYCKLKTTACQSKEMFLSTERGIPLWGVGKRALSTSSKLLTHKSTSVPLNRNSCKCPRVS